MCLQTITKTFSPPDEKVRTAWKLVYRKTKKTPYRYFRLTEDWERAVRVEIKTRHGRRSYLPEYYFTGFHVYMSRAEAREAARISEDDLIVIKVQVRGITYEGKDGTGGEYTHLRNLVAQEIRLAPKEELEEK